MSLHNSIISQEFLPRPNCYCETYPFYVLPSNGKYVKLKTIVFCTVDIDASKHNNQFRDSRKRLLKLSNKRNFSKRPSNPVKRQRLVSAEVLKKRFELAEKAATMPENLRQIYSSPYVLKKNSISH